MAEAKKSEALVIGFAATPVHNIIGVEGNYLKKLSFSLFNSPFCKEILTDCDETTIEDFFKQEVSKIRVPVRIINCNESIVDQI